MAAPRGEAALTFRDRIGITVPAEDLPVSEVPAIARRAEELGYTDLWSYERNVFDAFTPLAAAAAATERIRLGTSVANAFIRPPGLTAMSAAGVAHLAPGRFVLGVGSSTATIVHDRMGLAYERPLRRVRRTVRAVRKLLAGERVGEMRLERPPAEPVPIFVAALGERMLELCGEIADGLLLFFVGATCAPAILAATGRGFEAAVKLIALDSEDPAKDLDLARRFIASYALLPNYGSLFERQGFGQEVRAIREKWSEGDRSGARRRVSDAMIGELVLLGPADRWPERIAAYRRAGVAPDIWSMSTSEGAQQRRADFEHALEALGPVSSRREAVTAAE